jgi:hypothetical protein
MGLVRKPNAPLCVASTASGIVPCAETVQYGEGVLGALDRLDLVLLGAQPDAEQAQQARIVIDQQDLAF